MNRVDLTSISGVFISHSPNASDNRGSFTKYFTEETKPSSGSETHFGTLAVAHNQKSGTLRGLHFQIPPFAEEKLIACITGRIFDVLVDLRPQSRTYCKWAGIELAASKNLSIFVPVGIAHGYQSLEDDSRVLYALTSQYSNAHARVLNFADTDLSIPWPRPIKEISARDSSGLSLSEASKLLA